MKSLPKGVYVEGKSIGIDFRFRRVRYHELLKPNGISLSHTAANLKYAENFRAKILAAIQGEKMGGASFNIEEWLLNSKRVLRQQRTSHTGTIQGVLLTWLSEAQAGCAYTTMLAFNSAANEFIERWGSLAPAELTVAHIRDWIRDCQQQNRSLKTIKNRAIVLRGALNLLMESDLTFNPFDKIKWDSVRPSLDERAKNKENDDIVIYPFDLDELGAILTAAIDDVKEFLITGFGLGARPNELYGLTWEDIDVARGTLRFKYGRVYRRMTLLKTEESDRVINLAEFPHVWAALKRQKLRTFMLPAVDLGKIGNQDLGMRHFVFYNPQTGQPYRGISEEFLKGIWVPLLRKAGVRYRAIKQMRHTFATYYRLVGKPDLWTADKLGHTTTAMITAHYGRRLPPNADKMAKTEAELQQFWAKVA